MPTTMHDLELVEGMLRPERMANVIGQEPQYVKKELENLVSGEQIPGSFGDLIKRSIEASEQHKAFEGSNVVSMVGKQRR